MIAVVIVDDHQLFSEGLAAGLNALPDIEVTGTFRDGSAFLESIPNSAADVVLLDLEMPTGSGLEVLDRIRGVLTTIVISMYVGEDERKRAGDLGAAGYLSKATPLSDVAAAVRAVKDGHNLMKPDTTLREILDRYQEAYLDPGAASLTLRERQVLALMAQGITATDELADALFISQKTVKNHLANIYHKLAISDRAQAAVEAIRLGLGRQ